jgi:hypothetical protein
MGYRKEDPSHNKVIGKEVRVETGADNFSDVST